MSSFDLVRRTSEQTSSLPNRPPRFPRSLLGLSGVVDKIRILFDGTPTATAPHSLMVIEKVEMVLAKTIMPRAASLGSGDTIFND